jgi:hypothetical protein
MTEILYKNKIIECHLSGWFSVYSEKQNRTLKYDSIKQIKKDITNRKI